MQSGLPIMGSTDGLELTRASMRQLAHPLVTPIELPHDPEAWPPTVHASNKSVKAEKLVLQLGKRKALAEHECPAQRFTGGLRSRIREAEHTQNALAPNGDGPLDSTLLELIPAHAV